MIQTLTYDQVVARVTPSTIDLLYRDITTSDRLCFAASYNPDNWEPEAERLDATFGGDWMPLSTIGKLEIWETAKL